MSIFSMDDLPGPETTPVPQPASQSVPQPISDSVLEPHSESGPIESASSFRGLIHRLSAWVQGYKSLIQRIQALDETTPVDRLTPQLDAWQAPLAAAGVTIAQREQQLKRVFKSYGKMMITKDWNDRG